MSYQAIVPAKVASYFGISRQPAREDHPVIAQTFTPGTGWTRYPHRKRISGNVARQLRAAGVTSLALEHRGHLADFRIEEMAASL